MRKHTLNDSALMHGFLDVEIENKSYDLHNDYYCDKIILQDRHILFLHLRSIGGDKNFSIVFEDCIIESLDMVLCFSTEKGLTLDDLYRGRLEKDGKLIEVTPEGRKIFYISFDEEINMIVSSKETYIQYQD